MQDGLPLRGCRFPDTTKTGALPLSPMNLLAAVLQQPAATIEDYSIVRSDGVRMVERPVGQPSKFGLSMRRRSWRRRNL